MNRLVSAGSLLPAILLVTLINAAAAEAQLPAGMIGSTGGAVEMVDSSGPVLATSGQPLLESAKIRTGSASFVDLVIGINGINGDALVGEQSQIEQNPDCFPLRNGRLRWS